MLRAGDVRGDAQRAVLTEAFRADWTNIGDWHSRPGNYFSWNEPSQIVDVWKMPNPPGEHAAFVVGGGGLVSTAFPQVRQLVEQTPDRVVLWGIGHNLTIDVERGFVPRQDLVLPHWVSTAALIGVRDYGGPFEWVPCASCLHPLFDDPAPIQQDVVLFEHKRVPTGIKGIPTLRNDAESLGAVLRFLSSAETVVTNSYHGAYWALLLGRRVVALPFASKFYGFKHRIALCEPADWRRHLRQAEAHPGALAECRERNRAFYAKVMDFLSTLSHKARRGRSPATSPSNLRQWIEPLAAPGIVASIPQSAGMEPTTNDRLVRFGTIGRDGDAAAESWGGSADLGSLGADGPLPLLISYYTVDTPYEAEAERLRQSCLDAQVDHFIEGLSPQGSWERNCAMKADFCLRMWHQHKRPILWVDADATVLQRPRLLAACPADVGVHKWAAREFASGTLYFNNTPLAGLLLEAWARHCTARPDIWDQKHLETAWREISDRYPLQTLWLPRSYVRIFDAPGMDGELPVIVHHQASRRFKPVVSVARHHTHAQAPTSTTANPVHRQSLEYQMRDVSSLNRTVAPPQCHADADMIDVAPVSTDLAAQIGAETSALQQCIDEMATECARSRRATYVIRLSQFVQTIKCSGVQEVLIYGAGEVGRIAAEMCREANIHVHGFVETNPGLASSVEGLSIVTPRTASARSCHDYVIGSFGSAPAMLSELNVAYTESMKSYRAFVPPGPPPVIPTLERHAAPLLQYLDGLRHRRTLADLHWLRTNRAERMDAQVPLFKESRRDFHLARYRFASNHAAGRHVLDSASGTGYGARLLIEEGGALSVTGIDCSAEAISYANRYHGLPNATYVRMDADDVRDLARRFDLVTSFETIEHVPDDFGMLEAFSDVLHDDGTCVISTPDAWPVDASPHHVRTYTRQSFTRALTRHFADVRLFAQWSADFREAGGICPLEEWGDAQSECLIAVCRTPVRR